VVAARKKSQG